MGQFLEKVSVFFASKYRVTVIFWLFLILIGVASYNVLLKKEGFPSIATPYGVVQGQYFVEDVNEVDKSAVQPIIKSLSDSEYIKSINTTANENNFTVVLEFSEDVNVQDSVDKATSTIKNQANLPDEVDYSVQKIDAGKFLNEYDALMAIYINESTSYKTLQEKADLISEKLKNSQAVTRTEVLDVVEKAEIPNKNTTEFRQTSINKVGVVKNGETVFYPAISIGVVKNSDFDSIQLEESIQKTAEESVKSTSNLKNVKTTVTSGFAKTINSQLESLSSNLSSGLLAVLVVAVLLISWRASVVIALFMPLVVASTMGALYLFGYTLNTITLFSIILTLGLLVDDATIIVEAIDLHRREKHKKLEIIRQAVKKVGLASLAGTLTTLLVFSPMLMVSGILGEFIRLMPITVITALTLSFILSIIFVPFVSRFVMITPRKESRLKFLSILVPLEKYLAEKLSKPPLVAKKNWRNGIMISGFFISISIVAIGFAFYLAGKVPLDIFPASKDSDVILTEIEFAEDTDIKTAEKELETVENRIVKTLGNKLEYVNYTSANTRSAQLEVGLTPYQEREETSHNLIDQLEETGEFVGKNKSEVSYSQQDSGPPAQEYPFQMLVFDSEYKTAKSAAEKIATFIKKQELEINGKTIKVDEVIISENDSLQRTKNGIYVTISAKFSDTESNSASTQNLKDLVLEKYNEDELSKLGLTSDSLDTDSGTENENASSFQGTIVGMIVAVIAMYVLLVILFNSFSQPLLIFMAIPFSLLGVFGGLLITDNSLSFFVMVGILGLIGIAVNNTILLTEYANQERKNGKDKYTAISRAIKERLRPLVTTTLTTITALLPLALTDPFWQSLSYTLIFGMTSSSILILLSFPYFYITLEYVRDLKNKLLPGLE